MIHICCLNCFVLFSSFYGSLQDPPPRWILPPLPSSDSSSSPFLNPSIPSYVSSPFFLCHLRFSFNFLFTILFSLLLLGQWLPSFLQLILSHSYWLFPSYLPDILCSCPPLPPFFSHSPCSGSSIAPSINHSLHPSPVSSILRYIHISINYPFHP